MTARARAGSLHMTLELRTRAGVLFGALLCVFVLPSCGGKRAPTMGGAASSSDTVEGGYSLCREEEMAEDVLDLHGGTYRRRTTSDMSNLDGSRVTVTSGTYEFDGQKLLLRSEDGSVAKLIVSKVDDVTVVWTEAAMDSWISRRHVNTLSVLLRSDRDVFSLRREDRPSAELLLKSKK